MENPIKIDDLGLPLFLETPIFGAIFGKKSLRIPDSLLMRASQGDRSHPSGSLGVGGGKRTTSFGYPFFFFGGGKGGNIQQKLW